VPFSRSCTKKISHFDERSRNTSPRRIENSTQFILFNPRDPRMFLCVNRIPMPHHKTARIRHEFLDEKDLFSKEGVTWLTLNLPKICLVIVFSQKKVNPRPVSGS
ncbi:hypothetical protein PanWU01x14_026220, partial [Parasponia andersonii]